MQSRLPDSDELALILKRIWDAGSSKWPEKKLTPSVFLAHLGYHARRSADVGEFLSGVHAEDLYFSTACMAGDEHALVMVTELYRREIAKVIARKPTSIERVEIEQEVRCRLFVADLDKLPRIASFSGRGRLQAWLRVVVTRTIVDMVRGTSKRTRDRSMDLQRLPDRGYDPEMAYLKALYQNEFKAAFQQAIQRLTPKQRNLLRYHVLQGLSIDDIGALYSVHRATAARWLSEVRGRLHKLTYAYLSERLEVSRGELTSIFRLIQSQLDISIRRYLNEGT